MVNAERLTDFRPISCLNTSYKIIANILSKRLRAAVKELISSSQSAFVEGRLIVENTLLASEMAQGFSRTSISSRGMLMVDIRKAFDSVNWDFLFQVLESAEFPPQFVHWVRLCVSSVSYSVVVNGEVCGFFKGAKGLRQGDPISPYMFLLVMEYFSSSLARGYENGQIGYHPKARDLQISHLSFADDLLILFDGKPSSLQGILSVLTNFQTLSGLAINRGKSTLFSAGISSNHSEEMASSGFLKGSFPIRYLGLPLVQRKLRNSDYSPLLDKLASCFSKWENRALAYPGRVQLVKSVIYGCLNYWMQAFILSKGCLKRIEQMCSRFIWNGNIRKTSGIRVSWKSICLPKEEGGLGLRDLDTWNKTLCLKLIWNLLTSGGSLWVAWSKQTYGNGLSFWEIQERQTDGWVWKQLLRLRSLVRPFIYSVLGDGQSTSFWHDNWCRLGPLIEFFGADGPREIGIPSSASVADVVCRGSWALRPARSSKALELHITLTLINPPSRDHGSDSIRWRNTGDSNMHVDFNSKRLWQVLRPTAPRQYWVEAVWFKHRVPRHAFVFWMAHIDRLPVRSRLCHWGPISSPLCVLCDNHVEDRDHLFLYCSYSLQVWAKGLFRLGHTVNSFADWSSLITWMLTKSPRITTLLKKTMIHCMIYFLWQERNNRIHCRSARPVLQLFNVIDRCVRDRILGCRNSKGFRTLLSEWLFHA